MNEEKGKGRASDLDDSDKPPINEPALHSSTAILDRVTASAAGLVQSAFSAPTSNELSDAASAALVSTGKGRQLGRSSGSSSESSGALQQTLISTPQGWSLPSIRAGHTVEHIRDTESEFSSFLDGIDSFTPSSEPHSESDPSIGQALDILVGRAAGSKNSRPDQGGQTWYNTADEQQQYDGDAVLSILSNPSATTDELEALPVEEKVPNWGLTDQQISRLQAFTDELFPPSYQHIPIPIEHPLNLIPNMVSTSVTSDNVSFMDTTAEMSYIHFGDIPRNKAKEMWMEHWESVLTRYTDEVWGSLLPLVVEAREEVKAIKEEHPETTIKKSKALRRLRVVLDHLKHL